MNWFDEIDHFVNLGEDWDGYGGRPTLPEIGAKAKLFVAALDLNHKQAIYDMYPNSHGTISIEWANNKNEKLSLELGINGYAWFMTNNEADPIFKDGQYSTTLELASEISNNINKLTA